MARKHIGWTTQSLAGSAEFRRHINALESGREQLLAVNRYFEHLAHHDHRLRYEGEALAA